MVVSMDRWKGKVAVVTGASAGIGAAIVEHLVKEGLLVVLALSFKQNFVALLLYCLTTPTITYLIVEAFIIQKLIEICRVVGIARRKERVDQLATKLEGASGKLYAVKADISKEADILQAFKWVKKNLGPIHILVNNAGVFRGKGLIDGETEQWKEIFDTNVLGLCIATREAVKDMQANKVDGHIIHINSTDGHIVPNFPNQNVYPASKHAVTALVETLRQELNSLNSKIKITSISPGGVRTEIGEVGGSPNLDEYLKSPGVLNPEDIADGVVYVLSTPPHVQVHELTIKPVGEIY